MGDHFGIGLADKHIAFDLQCSAQFVVIFNDAVVDQGNTTFCIFLCFSRAMAEMGMRVVHCRCAMGRPTCVRDAGAAFYFVSSNLFDQF